MRSLLSSPQEVMGKWAARSVRENSSWITCRFSNEFVSPQHVGIRITR